MKSESKVRVIRNSRGECSSIPWSLASAPASPPSPFLAPAPILATLLSCSSVPSPVFNSFAPAPCPVAPSPCAEVELSSKELIPGDQILLPVTGGGTLMATLSLSHCHTVTPSHCHTVRLSHCHTVTLSHCHTITRSDYHTITPSHYHTITPSDYHTITLSHRHTVRLSHRQTITLSHCHTITPSHRHLITPSHYDTVARLHSRV